MPAAGDRHLEPQGEVNERLMALATCTSRSWGGDHADGGVIAASEPDALPRHFFLQFAHRIRPHAMPRGYLGFAVAGQVRQTGDSGIGQGAPRRGSEEAELSHVRTLSAAQAACNTPR